MLNPLAVNGLRTMPAVGPVVWGARTTVGADQSPNQWKYLPVRRLALYIEESLRRGTQWAVFEPNDEPLWSSLRLNVTTFMQGLFAQGAFAGTDAGPGVPGAVRRQQQPARLRSTSASSTSWSASRRSTRLSS